MSATREITIRDLLTHGSGLMSGGLGNATAGRPQRAARTTRWPPTSRSWARSPLDFQPGTLWRYSGLAGFDVLSRIVEIASGRPFDQFLQQRLFDPLGMKDTGFALTPAIQPRLVTLYRRAPERPRAAAGSERIEQRHLLLRRRRHGEHRRGLRAVRADAGQRRRAERPALSEPAERSS